MTMNPLLSSALGAIVRALLQFGAGYLVSAGLWTASEAQSVVAALTIGIVSVVWSLIQKKNDRAKLMVALAQDNTMSEADAQEMVYIGRAPSLATPATHIPRMKP